MADVDVVIDSLEGLPEPLHAHFQPTEDGKFKYSPPREDVAPLKVTLERLKREKAQAEKRAKDYRERLLTEDGEELSAEQLQELLSLRHQQQDQQGKQLVPKGELDRLLKDQKEALTKRHDTERGRFEEENRTLRGTLDKLLVEGGIRSALTSADLPFRPTTDAADMLIALARADAVFRVVEDHAVVWNGEGPRLSASGEPMGLQEWVIEQIKKHPSLMEASRGSGAGGGMGTGTVAAGLLHKKIIDMSERDKIDFMNKYGPEKWLEKVMAERKRRPLNSAA